MEKIQLKQTSRLAAVNFYLFRDGAKRRLDLLIGMVHLSYLLVLRRLQLLLPLYRDLGSMPDVINFLDLGGDARMRLARWFCDEPVEIIFLAVQDAADAQVATAAVEQDRHVLHVGVLGAQQDQPGQHGNVVAQLQLPDVHDVLRLGVHHVRNFERVR